MNTILASAQPSIEYQEILQRLYNQETNPKLDLLRISELLKLAQFDRQSMKIIQIVGTNGKGSTVAFIESLLGAQGISCGLFSSPHLCSARERIHINGQLISETQFIEAASHILDLATKMPDQPSFFECILAMALWFFQREGIEVAILEAGLGGRLDATTASNADVLGVSMIDFDHQHILGNTLSAIAKEKIAAARKGEPVVSVKQKMEVQEVLHAAEKDIGFHLSQVEPTTFPLGLFGEHQAHNAGLALLCLRKLGLKLTQETIKKGLMQVSWPGRFEIIEGESPIILDGAHNPSGIKALIQAIKSHERFRHCRLTLVFGSLKSPHTREKISLLLHGLAIDHVYLHRSTNARAELNEDLMYYFLAEGCAEDSVAALSSWALVQREAHQPNGAILVCGSLYTVGEARSVLLNAPTDPKQTSY